jgi:rubrerythrin
MKMEDYKKIIANAISKEVESYVFYRGVQEKVKDASLKKLFKELADQETGHREFLEGLLVKPAGSLHFDQNKDYKISQTIEKPPVTIDMKPVDGIALAIKKEQDAMDMYNQLSGLSTDAEQKKLFSELAKMELSHKTRLEDIYTNMAFTEAW